jgi:hypothetical protein
VNAGGPYRLAELLAAEARGMALLDAIEAAGLIAPESCGYARICRGSSTRSNSISIPTRT